MEVLSLFDILGPTMIGPSSSHTAGACRLGRMSRIIAGPGFEKVLFELHGSFADTYLGHGTDKALAAGVLGMKEYDTRLRNALDIAKENGFDFIFTTVDLGYRHENSVRMTFYYPDGHKCTIIGSSIGGGEIKIVNIDGFELSLTGKHHTLVIQAYDRPGLITNVCSILSEKNINIASLSFGRFKKNIEGALILETDEAIPDDLIVKIKELPSAINTRYIKPIS